MRNFFCLFTGSRKSGGAPDLGRRERYIVGAIIAVMLALGLVPGWVVNPPGSARPEHTVAQHHPP